MSADMVPIISVVIPTRDRLAFLREAVGSVLAQSLFPCEAIVVDDASMDGTAEWLAEHSDERVVNIRLDAAAFGCYLFCDHVRALIVEGG